MKKTVAEIIREIPKAENHYHLDAISPEMVWSFIERNKLTTSYKSLEEVRQLYHYHTLEEFSKVYIFTISAVCTAEDISDLIVACAQDMSRQNIVYREAMFDYPGCFASRIPFHEFAEGLEKGLKKAKETCEADIRFIANLDRTLPVGTNLAFLKELVQWLDRLPVVAVGLDNAEKGDPAHLQKEAFEYAKANGLHLTAHAGEDCGPESIIDALDSLHLDRIDHGIRAVENPVLMQRLSEEKVLCTLCPESNIVLSVYPNWNSYPLRAFLNAGIPVSISSDDPPYFYLDMCENLIKAAEQFQLTENEVISLVKNAFEYNFAGQEHLQKVEEYLAAIKL